MSGLLTQPNRVNDQINLDVNSPYNSSNITIQVDDLVGKNIQIMRNGWPNWGLRNRDLKELNGSEVGQNITNIVYSMLSPYVLINAVPSGSDSGFYSNEQFDDFDPLSQYTVSPFESKLFTNDDILSSLYNPIPNDEIGFLSFGKNKISIKGLTINLQEQTGLYAFKKFKFQFVIHRPDAFAESFVQSIFSAENRFIIRWGYNLNVSNSDLLPCAKKILDILGVENRDTIQFTRWDVGQNSNDHNIELNAEAIPSSNKSFITVRMGEHMLTSESNSASILEGYEDTLSTIDSDEQPRTRSGDRLRQNIQNQINGMVVDAFNASIDRIPKNNNLIKLSDILNEISSCINYSLEKSGQNPNFKFVCGKFNDTIQPSPPNISDFTISQDNFKNFNIKIVKSKNIPNPMDYLNQIVDEFLGDYTDYKEISQIIKEIYDDKQIQEEILRKKNQETQKVIDASNKLKEIDEKLDKIMIPSMKFFNYEHINEFNGAESYCFLIDSSYGVPKIHQDSEKSAFSRVVESNAGISQDNEEFNDVTVPGSSNNAQPNDNNTVFDIPIFNVFGENTILKDLSLTSETDEELQASLIKRMADKDLRGDEIMEGVSFNDQFKFLTTKISFKTIGNNAFVPYQQMFFRAYNDIGVFSRLYNVIGIEHTFAPGEWVSSYETVMNAI